MVLLLGQDYGSLCASGLSFTHEEYRKAKTRGIPVFAYHIDVGVPEPAQQSFIAEVENDLFRCRLIERTDDLVLQVTLSFLQEFHNSFRERHEPPSQMAAQPPRPALDGIELPEDLQKAAMFLHRLYENHQDMTIHVLASQCELRFADEPTVMGIVYAAEVNLAQDLLPEQVDRHRLEKAVEFWGRVDHDEEPEVLAGRLYNQGNALDALGRHAEAIGAFQEALKIQPELAEYWKNLGSAYDKAGDTALSVAALEKALALKPELVQGLLSLGALLVRTQIDPERGLEYLHRIPLHGSADDQRATVLTWKALACLQLGRLAEAVAHSESAVEAAPEQPWTWGTGAQVYSAARYTDAIWLRRAAAFFERFVTRFPEIGIAWAELGDTLWIISDWGEDKALARTARNAFMRAAELGYHDQGLVLDRVAHAAEALGEETQAEKFYRRAAKEEPAVFGVCLGEFLIRQRRPAEALPLLEAAVQQSPNEPRFQAQLGHCHDRLRNYRSAATAYEGAVILDPEDGTSWFNLGGMFWNLGERDRAREVWDEASRRFPDHEARKGLDESLTPKRPATFDEYHVRVVERLADNADPLEDRDFRDAEESRNS
jgi:tetratricopeptide (TPR) repeat protein